ncbi:MAG: hypothetical protein J2P40_08125 [Candidatus Dormibacteraeota bacterium]|nr:hypothetical protein [Candidatus Dormibacteraeota bacterium]MBO0761227.1 hypothetical protein [Candidatus Dormibacteraeota bacterium]
MVAPTYPNTNRRAANVRADDVGNQPADESFVLTSVLALGSRSGDPFFGLIDSAHVAAVGHSLGAITTIGLFQRSLVRRGCGHDARLPPWTLRGDASGLPALQRDGAVSGVSRLEDRLSGS